MVTVREPVLHTIAIAELRPTQITVGMREVHAKQKSWQEQDSKKRAEFLGRHMIPVIRGPKDRLYVLDHHHLSLALHNEVSKMCSCPHSSICGRCPRTNSGFTSI